MEVTINISDETVEWIEKAIKLKITPSRLRKIVEILWEEEIESLIDNDIFDIRDKKKFLFEGFKINFMQFNVKIFKGIDYRVKFGLFLRV